MQINGREVRELTDNELAYTRSDLREVIAIQRTFDAHGLHAPKLIRYEDELSALVQEVNRRAGKGLLRVSLTIGQAEALVAAVKKGQTDTDDALRGVDRLLSALTIARKES